MRTGEILMTEELEQLELDLRATSRGRVKSRKLVAGVGINDSDYPTSSHGKIICPYYKVWHNMLNRVYTANLLSYEGSTVCEDWLVFTRFKLWMEGQDWEGKSLDKDLRGFPNKVYSPSTCTFLNPGANSTLIGISPVRYYKNKPCKYLRGVYKYKGGYCAIVHRLKSRGEITRVKGFQTQLEAHNHWRALKAQEILKEIEKFDSHQHNWVRDFCEAFKEPIEEGYL